KPICKPDAARQRETGEMEPTERDVISPVRRGHRTSKRRLETLETDVVWLITQRSRVQIPPPLPGKTAPGTSLPGSFSATCYQTPGHIPRPIAGRFARGYRGGGRPLPVRAAPVRRAIARRLQPRKPVRGGLSTSKRPH